MSKINAGLKDSEEVVSLLVDQRPPKKGMFTLRVDIVSLWKDDLELLFPHILMYVFKNVFFILLYCPLYIARSKMFAKSRVKSKETKKNEDQRKKNEVRKSSRMSKLKAVAP